jgi:hypothetical protein
MDLMDTALDPSATPLIAPEAKEGSPGTPDERSRRFPQDRRTSTRRWLDDDDRDNAVMELLVRSAPPADILGWETKEMKEVLIAMGHPLPSYSNAKVVEGMMKVFFAGPIGSPSTPVLTRSSSGIDGGFGGPEEHGSVFAEAEAAVRVSKRAGLKTAMELAVQSPREWNIPPLEDAVAAAVAKRVKAEIEVITRSVEAKFQENQRAASRSGGHRDSSGMPSANEFFHAVSAATTSDLTGDNDDLENSPADVWTFHSSAAGGPPIASRVAAQVTRVHSRRGGSEHLYGSTARKFHPFQRFMESRRAEWPHKGLAREGMTIAVTLDLLHQLPFGAGAARPLKDAREVLVRRWLCLKWVAARTTSKGTPSFLPFPMGYESLLTSQDQVPDEAIETALVNAKYHAKVKKAQLEV